MVVVGHGPVGHRLIDRIRDGERVRHRRVTVLTDEPHPAYDRVNLSSCFEGTSSTELLLPGPRTREAPWTDLRLSTEVVACDPAAHTVTCADGTKVGYDALVLATGSRPWVPAVPGHDFPGCFTYRTLEDVQAIRRAARPGRAGVVVGGGLLGLEAANALRLLGMVPYVVETAPRLLPAHTDDGAGRLLVHRVRSLGMTVRCGTGVREVTPGADGRVAAVVLSDGTEVEACLVVFTAGIRPRDELAAATGPIRADRGGFLVDERCRTSSDRIWAIGECAAIHGRCYGLVAPGYRMAEAVARQLLGASDACFRGENSVIRLKLPGVDMAAFGDVHAETRDAMEFCWNDHSTGTYSKLVLAGDGRTLIGAILVGASVGALPVLHVLRGHELSASPEELLRSVMPGAAPVP
ncbi:NAD(P)/FAD-dependent oxidoreductase [Streptomyces anatolicus]|uniref:NAD(P)/FAD-dependent oxidoreductase n=1 Tax=Streptomyces anatolicus TaxID=2675858 RepID=UPI0027E21415|nr:FAD-dependent oxidoreductase [Streptomyces anatolicus]